MGQIHQLVDRHFFKFCEVHDGLFIVVTDCVLSAWTQALGIKLVDSRLCCRYAASREGTAGQKSLIIILAGSFYRQVGGAL